MPSPTPRTSGRLAAMLADRRIVLALLGVIIAGFLAYGVGWAFSNPKAFVKPAGDSANYEVMVKQLLTRGVYGYRSTRVNARVTPGYPVFLAAVYAATRYADRPGGPYRLIYWLQLLFAAGTIVLTYLIGSELLGRGPGLLAALLMALFPPLQQSATKLLTEPLATVLFLGFVFVQLIALKRDAKWPWLVAGLLLGATVMVRPAFVLAAVVPVVYVLITKRDWRRVLVQAALLAAGMALVMSPWAIRNAVSMHEFIILAPGADDPLLAGVDPYHFEKGWEFRYSGPSYQEWMASHGNNLGPYRPGLEVSKGEYARHVIGTMLQEQPARLIEWFTLGKVRAMFTRQWEGGTEAMSTVTWITQIAIVAFGFMGMVLAVKEERFRLLTFLVLVGIVTLLPYVPEPRYVFGYMPLLAVLAAGVMERAWNAPSHADPTEVAA